MKNENKMIIAVFMMFSLALLSVNTVSASDVLVRQGQYYTGTSFNIGTYNFNFTVYDALTGGNSCYTNTTTLTTGSFGEWITEQTGVNSACNNVSKDYYLNININGADQTPRRRLVVWDSLRKNVDETTISSFEADIIKVRTGFKDLNRAIWQSKLDYAREFANATLIAQREIALKLIGTTTNTGESTEFKIIKLQQAGELAKAMVQSALEMSTAKILEAKKLALLNGEKPEDVAAIEAEANLYLTALDLTAQEQAIIIDEALNDSITEVSASDDGRRFAVKDADGSLNLSSGDITTTGTGFFNYLGSLTSRITKLWVVDVDATGNIETSQNVSANYFKGDGSLLTNLPAGGAETDPRWTANSSTVARTGNCPTGQVVQNTTTSGVQCMTPSAGAESDPLWSTNFTNMQTDCSSDDYVYGIDDDGTLKCRDDETGSGSGLTPVYLGSNLNATNAVRVNVFTIALTPSKMNIVKVYLVQSSSTNGVAIQNRAIISASGPVGNCHFVTQTQGGSDNIDNIAVSNNSADTSVTAMGLDTNVPFINTVTCTVLANANQRNLTFQFISETASNVTTYAGSYYTNAVNQ